MKNKFRNLCFLSLGCASLLMPAIVAANINEVSTVRADYVTSSFTVTSDNFHLDYTDRISYSNGDYLFFNLPEWSMQATEGGSDRFNADGLITHIKADGTEKSYKANIAKQQAGEKDKTESGWYFQFNCWDGVNKFTVAIGESIRINGGITATRASGSYAGDSITFANDIVLTRFENNLWGKSKVEKTFHKNDLSLGKKDKTTLYFEDKTGTDYDVSRESDWAISIFKASQAAKFIKKSDGSEKYYDCGFKLVHTTSDAPTSLCLQINNTWNGVTIPVEPEVGDKILIENKTFACNYVKSATIYRITIEHIEIEWNGTDWNCPVSDTVKLTHTMDDVVSIRSDVNVEKRQFIPYLTLAEEDRFPVRNSWASNYVMKNGATIYPADGTEAVVRDILMMKLKEKQYSVLFYGDPWCAEYTYDFKAGDRMVIDGSFSTVDGYDEIEVTLKNFDLTFNGKSWGINFYRPALIQQTHEAIAAIDMESTLTSDCKAKIDLAKGLFEKLVPAENIEFSLEETNKLYKAERDYMALQAEANGKTVHRNALTSADYHFAPDFTNSKNKFYSWDFNGDVTIDYPKDSRWDAGRNTAKHSVKITDTKNNVTFVDSACVLSDDGKRINYYFVDWGGMFKNDYNFESGDLLEVGAQGYTQETDTDFYVLEIDANSLIFTEGTFFVASEHPKLREAILAINNIGTVEYTDACKERIEAARVAFDSLTDIEKANIPSKEQEVLDAEKEYNNLAARHEADQVVAKINAIGTVEYTAECKAKIDEARNAYNLATNEAKELITVEQYKVLTDAEEKYTDLGYEKEATDVVAAINAIGTVEYTDACKSRIEAARAVYDDCSENAKDKITVEQYKVLTDAEAQYAALKAKDDFVNEVAKLNDNLSVEQMYSVITNALRYYNKIEDKSSVANEYATLETYISKYNAMINSINESHEEAQNSSLTVINAVLVSTSLLAVVAAVISKKGIL